MDTASARLRKTFKYPEAEADGDGNGQGLDEQEQEKVIEDLREWDKRSTGFWKSLITGVILVITAFHVILLLYSPQSSSDASSRLLLVCGVIASLGSAIIVCGVPQAALDRFPQLGAHYVAERMPAFIKSHEPILADSPSLAVNVIFLLLSLLHRDMRLSAPGLVAFAIALLGRHTLRPINVAELERLKYNYKGA